jgi:hypothetical protein
MIGHWAATLPQASALEAVRLWAAGGIEVCTDTDRLWLRGREWDDDLDRSLRSLLGCERFQVLADGQLVPLGRSVPRGSLPEGPWSTLHDWFTLTVPPKAFPAEVPAQPALCLVRSTDERATNLLLVRFTDWYDYAIQAPRLRLDRLSFAASDDGQALIRGTPAPPIPGQGFVEVQGIATPAGWTWSPELDAGVLHQAWRLHNDDLAIFALDGTCDVVSCDAFVRSTRSAVRLTERGLHGG